MSIVSPEIVSSVTDVDVAFGGGARFLPALNTIPEPFRQDNNIFNRMAVNLFYDGHPGASCAHLSLKEEYLAVSGLVGKFIRSIIGSYQPKHEHKIAGVAYLLSEMFTEDKPNGAANDH